MIRRPPRSTRCISSAASDVSKRQELPLPPPSREPSEDVSIGAPAASRPLPSFCLLYTSPSPRD
eukprot:7645308-Alexandrium_andersonii.AAC.1